MAEERNALAFDAAVDGLQIRPVRFGAWVCSEDSALVHARHSRAIDFSSLPLAWEVSSLKAGEVVQGVDDESWARSFQNVYTETFLPQLVDELVRERAAGGAHAEIPGTAEDELEKKDGKAAVDDDEGPEVVIPLTIHHIWLGSELPQRFKKLRDEWVRMHPPALGWSFVLWDDAKVEQELRAQPLLNSTLYTAAQNWGEKSDILRLEILHRYGGVYVDVDFAPVQPLIPLLRTGAGMLCGLSNVGFVEINNGLIAACPGHPAILSCVNALSSAPPTAPQLSLEDKELEQTRAVASGPSEMLLQALGLDQGRGGKSGLETIARTGPGFFTRCVAAYVQQWEAGEAEVMVGATAAGTSGRSTRGGLETVCIVESRRCSDVM